MNSAFRRGVARITAVVLGGVLVIVSGALLVGTIVEVLTNNGIDQQDVIELLQVALGGILAGAASRISFAFLFSPSRWRTKYVRLILSAGVFLAIAPLWAILALVGVLPRTDDIAVEAVLSVIFALVGTLLLFERRWILGFSEEDLSLRINTHKGKS